MGSSQDPAEMGGCHSYPTRPCPIPGLRGAALVVGSSSRITWEEVWSWYFLSPFQTSISLLWWNFGSVLPDILSRDIPIWEGTSEVSMTPRVLKLSDSSHLSRQLHLRKSSPHLFYMFDALAKNQLSVYSGSPGSHCIVTVLCKHISALQPWFPYSPLELAALYLKSIHIALFRVPEQRLVKRQHCSGSGSIKINTMWSLSHRNWILEDKTGVAMEDDKTTGQYDKDRHEGIGHPKREDWLGQPQ